MAGPGTLEEMVDPATGELVPIVIVSDNGSAFRSDTFAAYIESRSEFVHVQTPRTGRIPPGRALTSGLEVARELGGYSARVPSRPPSTWTSGRYSSGI